jgi:signal transduction histidine kinase
MDTLERLRQVPLMKQLSNADLALIETLVRRARYLTGAIVCQQGGVGSTLYIIDSGSIEVRHVDSRNRERTLDFKHAGDVFGEAALLIGEPYKTTFIAHEDSDVLSIRREDLHDFLLQHPDLRPRLYAAAPPEIVTKLNQIHYDWLMEGELPILHTRKHWWAFIHELPRALIFIVGALIVAIVLTATPFGVIGWAIALFVISLILVFLTIDWRNDDYIITNRRVIHSERVLLVREERREATIDKVQNVKIEQPTLLQKIVGVSDVLITTAAVHGTIRFSTVGNGPAIRDILFEQIQRLQAQKMFEARQQLRGEIREQFEREEKPIVIGPPTAGSVVTTPTYRPPRRSLKRILDDQFALRLEYAGTITYRKHWVALFLQAWRPTVITLALLLFSILVLFDIIPLPHTVDIVAAVFMLASTAWFIWEFIDWSNDIFVLTKDRIADVERNPLGVIQHSTEAPLTAVQNVSYRQPNILYVFFRIGDVLIETAGQTGGLTFPWMSPPAQVANEILQYVERARDRQRQLQRAQQRADLFQWFGAYHDYLEERGRLHRASSDEADDDANQIGT